MDLYYREIDDPNSPGKKIRELINDDIVTQEDMIYQIPGGIENFDKYKEIMNLIDQSMGGVFDKKQQIKFENGITLRPEPKKQYYEDEELNRIAQKNEPREVKAVPDNPKEFFAGKRFIKLEGTYPPQDIKIQKIIDFNALPKIKSLSVEDIAVYKQAEAALPNLIQLKRGMQVKIVGKNLKIRPQDDREEGFFLVGKNGKNELTDFLQVNSTSVLLLNLPKDFPCGEYHIFISSGWYADKSIHRAGLCGKVEVV